MTHTAQEFRLMQIRKLWEQGFGAPRNAKTLGGYQSGIPPIPKVFLVQDLDLPFLALADPRPSFPRICKYAGVYQGMTEQEYLLRKNIVPFDSQDTDPTEPFWFRHDNGRKLRNRRVVECREKYSGNVRLGTALVGVFAYLHHPAIIGKDGYSVYLPGSVKHDDRFFCAHMFVKDKEAVLGTHASGSAQTNIGVLRYRLK